MCMLLSIKLNQEKQNIFLKIFFFLLFSKIFGLWVELSHHRTQSKFFQLWVTLPLCTALWENRVHQQHTLVSVLSGFTLLHFVLSPSVNNTLKTRLGLNMRKGNRLISWFVVARTGKPRKVQRCLLEMMFMYD